MPRDTPQPSGAARAGTTVMARGPEGGLHMSFKIRRTDYFNATVQDEPGTAYQLLETLAHLGINLLAFTAVPVGPERTQLALFPDDTPHLVEVARKAKLDLEGPYPALLVQGDDKLGAFAELHRKLYEASVNVYASIGVVDGRGAFGYVVYVRHEQYDRAALALGL